MEPSEAERPSPPDTAARRFGRPSRERTEAIDRKILDVAADLFMRLGPAVPMKAVVEASGLSSKTVYARFSSKADLFPAAIRHLLRDAAENSTVLPRSDDVRATLRDFIRQSGARAYEPGTMAMRRLLSADAEFTRDLGPDIADVVDRAFIRPLATFLREARSAGQIREIDADRTARALTTLILVEPASRLNKGLQPPTPDELDIWVDFLVDFVGFGIFGQNVR